MTILTKTFYEVTMMLPNLGEVLLKGTRESIPRNTVANEIVFVQIRRGQFILNLISHLCAA